MIKKILILAGVIVALLVAVIASQPNEFRITRSTVIHSSPEKVFEQVNNFHNWERWSPWAKLDPTSQVAYEGPAAGVGAVFRWAGNDQVGQGSNTIVESRPNELIRIKLEFIKPFQGVSTAEFNFDAEGGRTSVTWSMYGKNNFIGKAVSLIMNCDKMVGAQFEAGLANLKKITETPAAN